MESYLIREEMEDMYYEALVDNYINPFKLTPEETKEIDRIYDEIIKGES